VLQAEAKKLEDASTYLSLPSTKIELEEKGHSATGKSMQNLGSCTISKDSFQISTLVCSTKLTQNGEFIEPLEFLSCSMNKAVCTAQCAVFSVSFPLSGMVDGSSLFWIELPRCSESLYSV